MDYAELRLDIVFDLAGTDPSGPLTLRLRNTRLVTPSPGASRMPVGANLGIPVSCAHYVGNASKFILRPIATVRDSTDLFLTIDRGTFKS